MASHNELGKWGEDVAMEYYLREGYAIRGRNVRINHLEIDLVVTRGNRMAFVEVKTRAGDDFCDPIEAVNAAKRRHMVNFADIYLRSLPSGLVYDWQFDIVIVTGRPDDYTVDRIPDAFTPEVGRMVR